MPCDAVHHRAQRVEKVFFDTLQTLRNTRRQGNRSDRRTKVRRGAVDTVSKNAFTQPFLRLCEILFIYLIFSLRRFTFLHFCGAWVYRQSEPCDAVASQGFSYVGVHYSSFIALWINLHIGYSERKPSRMSGCSLFVKTVSFSYVKLAVQLMDFRLYQPSSRGETSPFFRL